MLTACLLVVPLAAPPVSAQGLQCSKASDCGAPLVCTDGRCRVGCVTNRDCAGGRFCVPQDGRAGFGLCAERAAIDPSWFPRLLPDIVIWGADIANMPLRRVEPLDCHSECLANPECESWSFASRGGRWHGAI